MNTQKIITLENQTMKFFYSKSERKIYLCERKSIYFLETNKVIVNYSLDIGFNDITFPYAYGEENIYFYASSKIYSSLKIRNFNTKKRV